MFFDPPEYTKNNTDIMILELKNYIDRVTAATGKDKVQLIGRCYGANVIATYLELYKEHAKQHISDISYFSFEISYT